jgi:hypothetical protein|tara:strand:+ start:109 stop:381 length:273 start_codon:yes stop_codon:yes gene_type:complete
MNSISDKKLIKNHTVFFAYFCYLLDSNQVDVADELCEIGWKLDEEIRRRKITEVQIEECINKANLNPEDQCMVGKYIYPDSDLFKTIGDT